jgi:hypothetical protein
MATTVCVWTPGKHPKTGAAYIGHASLLIGKAYFSFRPAGEIEGLIGAMTQHPSDIGQDFEEEKKLYGRHPSLTTVLNGLDENEVAVFLNHFCKVYPQYSAYQLNCCHPVKMALYAGVKGTVQPDSVGLRRDVYGSPVPVILQGTRVESEICKVWNPLDVHRYAVKIKRIKG